MKTQEERVLERLRKGHTLTQLQAFNWWGIMRLGAVVYRYNHRYKYRRPWDFIKSEKITVTNRYGQRVTVARYSL